MILEIKKTKQAPETWKIYVEGLPFTGECLQCQTYNKFFHLCFNGGIRELRLFTLNYFRSLNLDEVVFQDETLGLNYIFKIQKQNSPLWFKILYPNGSISPHFGVYSILWEILMTLEWEINKKLKQN